MWLNGGKWHFFIAGLNHDRTNTPFGFHVVCLQGKCCFRIWTFFTQCMWLNGDQWHTFIAGHTHEMLFANIEKKGF